MEEHIQKQRSIHSVTMSRSIAYLLLLTSAMFVGQMDECWDTERIKWMRYRTTVQKMLGQLEVSKDVYVNSFKQHAFDPLLSNKTTD